MNLDVAWQRSQNFNRIIGIRPDIRNASGDRIVENFDSVTLTIDEQEIQLENFDLAKMELQLRGISLDGWK